MTCISSVRSFLIYPCLMLGQEQKVCPLSTKWSPASVTPKFVATRLAAEVSVVANDQQKGRNEAFRVLGRYIFGQNRKGGEIAMTSVMRFFLPSKVTRNNTPAAGKS